MTASVAIVGGGISGLSTAYYLAQAGIASTLIEARPHLGGVIQSEHVEGCVIEGGPDSFLSVKPAAMDLIRELGMAGDVIGSNDHLRVTYVWKGGRLVPMPDGLQLMVPTKLVPVLTTRLLSWPTKFRMGMDLFRPPGSHPEDQSVADFVTAHYGAEAVDYLAEPLLSGIFGGSPSALSVLSVLPRFVELEAKYGSLTKGVLAERKAHREQANGLPLFRTLKGGLGQLVAALTERLEGHATVLHQRALAIERSAGGFRIRLADGSLECAGLVLACEAYNAAALAQHPRRPPGRTACGNSVQLVDDCRAGIPGQCLPQAAARFRFSRSQARAPPPGGLHLGGHEIPEPRIRRDHRTPLLPGRHGRRRYPRRKATMR